MRAVNVALPILTFREAWIRLPGQAAVIVQRLGEEMEAVAL